jgi:hypothetical protein
MSISSFDFKNPTLPFGGSIYVFLTHFSLKSVYTTLIRQWRRLFIKFLVFLFCFHSYEQSTLLIFSK